MTIMPRSMVAIIDGEDDDMAAMKKVDNEYFEKNDKYLYWNTNFMAARIRTAMAEEVHPCAPSNRNTLWYSLRLKFTDDVIRKEAIDFLNGKFDYRKEIYGYKIYDIMKKYIISYPQALFKIYSLKNNGKDDSGYTLDKKIADFFHITFWAEGKISNSILHENGIIEYLEKENKIKTQEEIDKEFEKNEKRCEEIRRKLKENPPEKRKFD